MISKTNWRHNFEIFYGFFKALEVMFFQRILAFLETKIKCVKSTLNPP